METPVNPWPAKHNWRYIARESAPKRAAAERICDFDEIYGLFDEATARARKPVAASIARTRSASKTVIRSRIEFQNGSHSPPTGGFSKPQHSRVQPAICLKSAAASVRRIACVKAPAS
jgi:hypothetical protein